MIVQTGTMVFDPPPMVRHHEKGRTALIELPPGLDDVYRWLLQKEYGLTLIKPVRPAHITVVPWYDSGEIEPELWEEVKARWSGFTHDVTYRLPEGMLGMGYWWLPVVESCREPLHQIRVELGLPPRPLSGTHLTIGSVRKEDQARSDYIESLRKNKCPY